MSNERMLDDQTKSRSNAKIFQSSKQVAVEHIRQYGNVIENQRKPGEQYEDRRGSVIQAAMQTIHEIDQEKTCLSQDPSRPEEHIDASQRLKKGGNVATSPN